MIKQTYVAICDKCRRVLLWNKDFTEIKAGLLLMEIYGKAKYWYRKWYCCDCWKKKRDIKKLQHESKKEG